MMTRDDWLFIGLCALAVIAAVLFIVLRPV